MMDYQKDTLREAFRKDENGLYVYSTIIWSDIKKSAKSSICAAVSLYMADNIPWAENYHIANDLKQADTRVGKYARRAIDLSPYLSKRFRSIRNTIKHRSNGSVIESIPIDPSGEAGSNADFIQFSELWGAIEEAKSRMWTEMTLSPTKFGKSLRWVESYAGYEEESEILYNLWETGVEQGELVFPDKLYHVNDSEPTVLELYKNENARMLCLWNTQPRCLWQTKEYYKQEAAILHPNEFNRMHRNQWISNTDTFIPIEWWDACAREKLPNYPRNHPMIIALDAAVSDDTFGVTMSCRQPEMIESQVDGRTKRVHKYPDDSMIVYARRWKPTPGRKVDYAEVEQELRRLIATNNIAEVAYDPYQLHDMCSRLYKEGLAFFRPFPQGGGKHSRLIADSALRDRIRDRRIWHDGTLTHLRKHLQNADAKVDTEDRKVRIVKRVQKLKVDLAVCLSMSDYEVKRLNI